MHGVVWEDLLQHFTRETKSASQLGFLDLTEASDTWSWKDCCQDLEVWNKCIDIYVNAKMYMKLS